MGARQGFSLAFGSGKGISLLMANDNIHAVLTGDLVASTTLPEIRAEAAMAAIGRSAAGWAEDLRFTRFRGDGWQVLIPQPGQALRVALALTAALAAADTGLATRLAIGFGEVTRPGAGDLSAATGPAFIRSGRALDQLPRGKRWAVSGGKTLPPWIAAAVPLAEWHSSQWTKGQAAVVADWLDPGPDRTQEDRAENLGLTRQAWKSRFDGSGIAAWSATLQLWEQWKGAGVTHD